MKDVNKLKVVQCNVLLLCIPYLRKWLFEAHSLSMRTNNRKINYKKDQMFLWPWHMIISYVAYYPLKWTIKKKFIFFQWKDLSNATDNIKRNCNNYERQRQIDTSQILNATDNIKRKCNHCERQRQIDLCQILNQQYFIKIQNHCLLPMQ